MQVIMEIEEFNRLNDAYKILEDVKSYLEDVVKYSSDANDTSIFDAYKHTKAMQPFEVSKVAYILGLYPRRSNIDEKL